ncbi:MAG: type II toxin-antitoxin system RelE/ParE family toxin [Planctomycetia bacterium]|nr:type II toxin-antitoxin system RelE/ParE family toxin [Planctomycetia bacterium]
MANRRQFAVLFAPEAVEHLDTIARSHHRAIEEAIDEQLAYTPETATRNRKPLEQPAPYGATWELRCGPQNRFRVFYEVDGVQRTVFVLAIGVKDRNRLYFGGEEFET